LQDEDVEKQLPAAINNSVDNSCQQKKTRIPIKSANRLDVMRIEIIEHGTSITERIFL